MSRPRLAAEQQRELVLEYLTVPHGHRMKWLAERNLNRDTFYRWRKMMIAGALETGMIPRGGVMVSADENRELGRLHAENKKLRTELEKAHKGAESKDRVINALGKAIELLQDETASKRQDNETGRL